VKFIVDAQLPRGLCRVLVEAGYDALHTVELPDQNRTPGRTINALSAAEQRVVISKDTDFYYSHILHGRPYKLLLIRTGNISVRELCDLVKRQLPTIIAALEDHSLVELYRSTVRVP
jgi:predicted nuclease of predicted toxin-antitoxin system